MSDQSIHCPCGSGEHYAQCCSLYHKGAADAPTAEKLMRSRFSAYAMNLTDYLIATTWPCQQGALKSENIHNNSDGTRWHRLEIIGTTLGQTSDTTGEVEFKAWFSQPPETKEQLHQERSSFIKETGKWYFIFPNIPQSPADTLTPGRNDPCSCGSGKKFKKCCMP